MSEGQLPFERLFSLPALEGLRLLKRQMLQNPGLDIEAAATILERIEADPASLDLDAAKVLIQIVPADIVLHGADFYRTCIRGLLVKFEPVWARAVSLGRIRFYQALERDEQSLFRQTGILDDPAPDDFVDWWDALNQAMRAAFDKLKVEQGRAAERLTLEAESIRLRGLGIKERPRWVGLDDNTKGYDVLSFEIGAHGLVNKLIEVKSTIASPLRFRLTRNEWEQAERFANSYVFHIWDMRKSPPLLHIRTVDQVRPHVPQDNMKGKWKDAEIAVGSQ